MTLARTFGLIVVLVGLAASSLPAAADQRGGHRGRGHRGSIYRGYTGPVYGRYPAPVYHVPPPYFAQPYYRFRPRYNVAGGLWLGFAVPFPRYGYAAFGFGYPFPPYAYGAAYPVPYSVPYSVPAPHVGYPQVTPIYPPAGSTGQIGVNPTPTSYGGISLEISPPEAEVWVDGGYAGRAGDFGPQRQPLTLAPGVHRIELRAPGFVTSLFDVTVTPGYVMPYQGTLQPTP
jgi:hypothetical protein